MTQLVLSLFPGIGLLDRAFEEEGFCVVRGPDLLWGGDIRRFHPPYHKFDGVIGGPPCQRFSRLRHLVKHNGGELALDLIPEFERCVDEAKPDWFLMENVVDAPAPSVFNYEVHSFLANNRWTGAEQNRQRRFSFGNRFLRRKLRVEWAALEAVDRVACVTSNATMWDPERQRVFSDRTNRYFRHACRAQGLDDDYELPGFLVSEKIRAVCNGVPLPLGRVIAQAVKRALEQQVAA